MGNSVKYVKSLKSWKAVEIWNFQIQIAESFLVVKDKRLKPKSNSRLETEWGEFFTFWNFVKILRSWGKLSLPASAHIIRLGRFYIAKSLKQRKRNYFEDGRGNHFCFHFFPAVTLILAEVGEDICQITCCFAQIFFKVDISRFGLYCLGQKSLTYPKTQN